jgi:crotonobetainyl-CoA:carnitine CoA-transferase CaiB-like acyl-CoA transferase
MSLPDPSTGPLAGLVVVDASTTVAGPSAAAFLGDYGATVIKVEHPRMGDPARAMGDVKGSWWTWLGRGKRSVTCNLSTPEGAALFRKLVTEADVLIENFRPGRMERWGLGYEELSTLNQGLVMVRISGFGQFGPYAGRRAYGALAEAMSGAAFLTGDPDGPPMVSDYALADMVTGVVAAAVAGFALRARESRGGRGECIDLGLYSSLLWFLGRNVVEYDITGVVPRRKGGRWGEFPRNIRQTRDGHWVVYSMPGRNAVESLLGLLNLADDERFATLDGILAHADDLDAAFGEWISSRDREQVMDACVEAEVPIAPVYDLRDVVEDPHVLSRGDIAMIRRRDGSEVRAPVPPARLIHSPVEAAASTDAALGADNATVYGEWLGVTPEELSRLRAAGAV